MYNILKQLLPTVQYDLYEDVDGEKPDSLLPEESPLLPGPVKMHRKADTTNKSSVSIKNHFSREDFQDLPTEIDLDLKYSDHAVIDKNKGVINQRESLEFYSTTKFWRTNNPQPGRFKRLHDENNSNEPYFACGN